MKLYRIVIKDILRRKRRVLYAAFGVLIGTMTVVGVLNVAYAGENKIYSQLEKYGANLTIIPDVSSISTGLGDLSLGTISVGENFIQESVVSRVQEIADGEIRQAIKIADDGQPIATVAPRLYINAEVRGVSVIITGIDPGPELAIKNWWKVREGTYLERENQALIGSITAELLKLKPGDTLNLNGVEIVVIGLLEETGGGEDYQVMMQLSGLQKIFNKEGLISTIDVRALCNACPVEIIASEIHRNIPGVKALAVKQIANSEMELVSKVSSMMIALAGVTLLIGIFGVVNTMMTSLHERTKDIGIMRAVGASRNQIMAIFMIEAALIGVLGGILGYLGGTALAFAIGPLIFENISISFLPEFLPLALGLAIAVAGIASIYPAIQATRIKIAEAFRTL
jgi:putative ABC transport system permease protein